MKGEEIVDDTCWIIKSHYPLAFARSPIYQANKSIVIVRNPLESAISWLNLLATHCHSSKCPFNFEELYPTYWDWWVKYIINHINNWMMIMITEARERRLPILFLRFEDLVMNPEPELIKIMRFLIDRDDLSGTNAERRIKEVLSMGEQATQTYSLKDTTRRLNANIHRYTQDQQAWVKEKMKEVLHYFGYAKLPEDLENPTGFFDYSDQGSQDQPEYKGWQ